MSVATAPDSTSEKKSSALRGLEKFVLKREAAVASAVAFRYKKKIASLKRRIAILEEKLGAPSGAPLPQTSPPPPTEFTDESLPPFDPEVCQVWEWEGEEPSGDYFSSLLAFFPPSLSNPIPSPEPPDTSPLAPSSVPAPTTPEQISSQKSNLKIFEKKTVTFSDEVSIFGEGAGTSSHPPLPQPLIPHQPTEPIPATLMAPIPPMPQAFVQHFAQARGMELGEGDGPIHLLGEEAQVCEETWASNHPFWGTLLHTANKRKKKKKRNSN